MAVYRVDVLIEDAEPVFQWIKDNIPRYLVVRKIAYKTVKGWYVKAVFKRRGDAKLFHHRWYPEADDHIVAAFVTPN
jgi:hypothetical protein